MFRQDDTKAIKGVAILMMLFYHMVGFPDRYPTEFRGFLPIFPGFSETFLIAFADGLYLCVPLFFFLGGYGLYKRWQKKKSFGALIDDIIRLYKKYWRVLFILIPIGYLFFSSPPKDAINPLATRYVIESPRGVFSSIISNLLGISTSLCGEWWFFGSYLCFLPFGYLMCRSVEKRDNYIVDVYILLAIDIFLRDILPLFEIVKNNFLFDTFFNLSSEGCSFFAGIVFARYDAIVVFKEKMNAVKGKKCLCILGCALVFFCNRWIVAYDAEMLYSIALVLFMSVLFDELTWLKSPFILLGKRSTDIWLIHALYCYYFYGITKLVYCTRYFLVDFLILIFLSLGTSYCLDALYALFKKCLGKGKKVEIGA